jgi:mRNA interferase MazF
MNIVMEKTDLMVDQLRAIDNRRFLKRLGMIRSLNQKKLAENIQIILN